VTLKALTLAPTPSPSWSGTAAFCIYRRFIHEKYRRKATSFLFSPFLFPSTWVIDFHISLRWFGVCLFWRERPRKTRVRNWHRSKWNDPIRIETAHKSHTHRDIPGTITCSSWDLQFTSHFKHDVFSLLLSRRNTMPRLSHAGMTWIRSRVSTSLFEKDNKI
jgi:hypothetical protein